MEVFRHMILGLNGDKENEVAAYLIKEHGFERRAFADPMKQSIAALLNIPYHEIDKYKNNSLVYVEIGEYASDQDAELRNPTFQFVNEGLSFRKFISRFADSHREVFGDDFWLDFTLPTSDFYSGKSIVVTDMRHDNEAIRVRSCGGFRVHVENPSTGPQDELSRELIDYYLVDDESITTRVEKMIVDLATIDFRYKMVMRDE